MDNKMKMTFTARPENEAFARAAVASFISCLDPTIEELTEIKTGVSEAVSNSIIHGYQNEEGEVVVKCKIDGNRRITITVIDEGVGIADIPKAMEPMFTTGRAEERSGMGFTVMESFMDKLKVESAAGQGTMVTMVKLLDTDHGA